MRLRGEGGGLLVTTKNMEQENTEFIYLKTKQSVEWKTKIRMLDYIPLRVVHKNLLKQSTFVMNIV